MKNKFKNFLSVNYLFKDYFLNKKLNKDRSEIEKSVDTMIETGNKGQMKILIDKGYLFSWKQFKKILFEKRDFYGFIWDNEKYISLFNNELKELFLDEIKTLSKTRMQVLNSIGSFASTKGKERAQRIDRLSCFLSGCSEYDPIDCQGLEKLKFSSQEISQLYQYMLIVKNKKNQIARSLFGFEYRTYHGVVEEIFTIIEEKYNLINQQSIEYLGDKYNALNIESGDKVKEKIIQDMDEKKNSFNSGELGKEAKVTYNEIKVLIIELQQSSLEKVRALEFKNIIENQLPRTISEYIAIPKKYRDQLKINEDSPDKILSESLMQIKEKLTQMSQEIQEDKFNKMKVTHRYLKNSLN